MGSVGKLPSETKEQMRAGRHLKNIFLRAQELLILTRKKLGRGSRRPAWLSRDLSGKPRHKTKMHRQWRQGVFLLRRLQGHGPRLQGGDQEGQGTQTWLKILKKKITEVFCKYVGQQRKIKVPVLPQCVKEETWLQRTWRRYSVTFFPSVFTSKCSGHTNQVAKSKQWTRRMKNHPLEEKIRFKTI